MAGEAIQPGHERQRRDGELPAPGSPRRPASATAADAATSTAATRDRDRRPHARQAVARWRRTSRARSATRSATRAGCAARRTAARACGRSRRPRPTPGAAGTRSPAPTCCALRHRVAPHRRVVGAPRLVERRTQRPRAASETIQGAAIGAERRAASTGAASRAAAVQPATRNASCAISTVLRRRLSKIFQRESSDSRLGSGPSGPGTVGVQPGQELPVAADPAVLAPRVGEVARRVVVVDARCRWRAPRGRRCPRSGRGESSVFSGKRPCVACSNASTS